MATIKLQPSGNVLIKDGKVSCGCCEQPVCCMYAADAFVEGLVAEDFPEKIIYNGIEATRSPSFSGYPIAQYFSFGHPPYSTGGSTTRNIVIALFRPFLGNEWVIRDGFGNTLNYVNACLITGPVAPQPHEILDVFANTYTVTGLPGPQQSVQIVRQSLCRWRGDAGGQKVLLRYWDGSESSAPSGANQIGWWLTAGEQGSNAIRKTGYQSSPDGSYGGFTVS